MQKKDISDAMLWIIVLSSKWSQEKIQVDMQFLVLESLAIIQLTSFYPLNHALYYNGEHDHRVAHNW